MSNRLFCSLLIAALAAAAFAVIWHRTRTADTRLGVRIERRLGRAAAAGRTVRLRDLTAARFDRLVVIRALADAGDIRRAVGFDWRRADDLAYHCCESPPIWAFVRGRSVIGYFMPGLELDDGDGVRSGDYAPSTAITFVPDGSGRGWRVRLHRGGPRSRVRGRAIPRNRRHQHT